MKKTVITSLAGMLFLLNPVAAYAATYHVTHTQFASWNFSCNITTKGDKITAVRSLSIRPIIGSITNKAVTLSGNGAQIRFTKHIQALAYHQQVKIKVSKSQVYVSIN